MKAKTRRRRRIQMAARSALSFFLLMAFVITCCFLVFLQVLASTGGFVFTEDNIRPAASLTFGMVLLLTLICTVVDTVRRVYTVERPVRHITQAAERMMQGDFTARIQPLRSANRADGYDLIIRDFNKMAEELSGVETLRTDFISNVSHEMKTPLAAIQNYGTLLQQPDLPEEQRMAYANAITASSRRLADLITDILKLNKLENQQIFPQWQRFDLSEQLCQCLLDFESAWEQRQLCVDLAEGVMVESDAELLALVWRNLISNAVKFTPPGGAIHCALRLEGEFAAVEVRDTGCGIDAETGKHIFEKFYQGDTSHATQGNGLGLALVRRVMDIVGGDIRVSSEVGKGSTFTVRLRRTADEEA